jgi:general secretion pathway protein G
MKSRKTGFTLIEILIVVIILGILAAIVIPQFTEASSDAKESTLVSNLQTMRSQLGLYKVQHDDQHPNVEDDVADADVANFILRLTEKSDVTGTLDAAGDYGPYMPDVPRNPFQSDNAAPLIRFGADPGTDAAHWCFDPLTGDLRADDSEVNSNGIAHSIL